ncbi:MAG: SulP family inorganic anion transporter [Actinomycetes bacterium]
MQTKTGMTLLPLSLRGYHKSWIRLDVVAGLTLAAVAIPETMGYATIAEMPVVTGLYTVIFPTLMFALLGASKLLVVGADSATAALMAAGLTGLGVAGLTPYSNEWVAWAGLVALVTGALLVLARLLRLGFIGDFLSASVLIGFLTGVGVQVLTGQIPGMLGVTKGTGNWFEQQWTWITEIPDANWYTVGFAVLTLACIYGFKQWLPKIPGALVAIILSIAISSAIDAKSEGVSVIGAVQGGFPPIGLPKGVTWSDATEVLALSLSCLVLIIAQSAATSRSFAMKHGEKVDVNRDIVGLSAANVAAGLTGTFVVNGSPTKTQILDEDQGRTQLANMTMSAIVLLFVLFFTSVLENMPNAVLAAIVFTIGISLIDALGLKVVYRERQSEFVVAIVTAVVVCCVGVEQGIILAIILSIIDLIRRQYSPKRFVVGVERDGVRAYESAEPGSQSAPGLLIFRYDADLFYANANRMVEDVQRLVTAAPDPVRWLVLDCSVMSDADFTAGRALNSLVEFVHDHGAVLSLAEADTSLIDSLKAYGVIQRLDPQHVYPTLADAIEAFRSSTTSG